jgi:hypothetical protein
MTTPAREQYLCIESQYPAEIAAELSHLSAHTMKISDD